jgi:uncharacterized protein
MGKFLTNEEIIIEMQTPIAHPQEIEVWYILPAIRSELVVSLKKEGLSQRKIAYLLGVTESAISQYTKSKRAQKITFNSEVKEFISNSVKLINSKTTAYQQIQKISNFIRNSKAICEIHMQLEGKLESCDICYQ